MWIHFSRTEHGSSGGGLDAPFNYMGRIISDKFQVEKIEFLYEEIEINLVFSSPEEKNEKYREWCNKLPYYYRGKNMIRVSLSVLEREKTLADVFKFIYGAFSVIISKKKR